jgi:hypothetical protein
MMTGIDPIHQVFLFSSEMIHKVQKPSNVKCSEPSSEPFQTDPVLVFLKSTDILLPEALLFLVEKY